MLYVIKVRGHLDKANAFWLEDFDVTHEEKGITEIRGEIQDQAALFGILKRLQERGICLISVNREEKGEK